MGGRILTSEECMLRFFKALADSDTQYFDSFESLSVPTPPKKSPTEAQRRASIEKAERFLDKVYGPGWKTAR